VKASQLIVSQKSHSLIRTVQEETAASQTAESKWKQHTPTKKSVRYQRLAVVRVEMVNCQHQAMTPVSFFVYAAE
jgi:hypothetical protein